MPSRDDLSGYFWHGTPEWLGPAMPPMFSLTADRVPDPRPIWESGREEHTYIFRGTSLQSNSSNSNSNRLEKGNSNSELDFGT